MTPDQRTQTPRTSRRGVSPMQQAGYFTEGPFDAPDSPFDDVRGAVSDLYGCGDVSHAVDAGRARAEALDALARIERELSMCVDRNVARDVLDELRRAQADAALQMAEKLRAQMALKAIVVALDLNFADLGNGWTEATPKILARIEVIVDEAERAFRERDSAQRVADGYASVLADRGAMSEMPEKDGWGDEYTPEHQDEYRRLWHEAAAARDDYKFALRTLMDVPSQNTLMLNAEARAMYEIARRAIEGDTRHVG